MHFRLVPKPTTSDDLEGYNALCFKTYASFEAQHENVIEDRPILLVAKM